MRCPRCGREIRDSANFCNFCGNPVMRMNVPGGKPAKEKNLMPWVIAGIAVLVVIVGAVVFACCMQFLAENGGSGEGGAVSSAQSAGEALPGKESISKAPDEASSAPSASPTPTAPSESSSAPGESEPAASAESASEASPAPSESEPASSAESEAVSEPDSEPKESAPEVYPEENGGAAPAPAESESEPAETDDSWKQIYVDMIERNPDPYSFKLIQIDDDDIPELFFTGSAVNGTQIAWVSNGELKTNWVGYGEVLYYEKQGLFCGTYINHGTYMNTVFTLENHELTEIFSASATPDFSGEGQSSWSINRESVTQEEYQAQLDSAFDFEHASKPDASYSREEIIDAIYAYGN